MLYTYTDFSPISSDFNYKIPFAGKHSIPDNKLHFNFHLSIFILNSIGLQENECGSWLLRMLQHTNHIVKFLQAFYQMPHMQ